MSAKKKQLRKLFVITGGSGFLGQHILGELLKSVFDENVVFVPSSKEFDLRDFKACKKVVSMADVVIHLAARVGGIGYNLKNPGQLFYDNAIMGIQLMEAARLKGVEKFVGIGTICSYPKFTPVPFKEESIWDGYPEETNAPYGLAKKMLLVQAQAYRQQYGFNAITLFPVNLYGPGDNFNPESSHVIPALIKKFVEARIERKKSVEIWGTGNATREFLFVKDAARAIVLATLKYNKPDPVNIGSGMEISIRDLVYIISKIIGYQGEIVWDSSKPDGQPRRCLDVSRAREEFGFKARTSFSDGIRKTISWYLANYPR